MIVLRQKFYLVSDLLDLDNEVLSPVVPRKSSLGYHGEKLGDTKTPRLVFYPSIDSAIIGYQLRGGVIRGGTRLAVYVPQNLSRPSIYQPGILECPYSTLTNEWWCLAGTRIRKQDIVRIIQRKSQHSLTLGPRASKFEVAEWEWMSESWPTTTTSKVYVGLDEEGLDVLPPGPLQFYKTVGEARRAGKYVYRPQVKLRLIKDTLKYYGQGGESIKNI